MIALAFLLAAASLGFGTGTNFLTKGESIAISARSCDVDRKSGVVLFEGSARVDYHPGYTLCADRVFALFSGTNELDRLVAAGNVAITNEQRVGACDRAVFNHKTGELEMTAPDDRPATLCDGTGNSMSGRKIRFWIRSEQVEITQSELLVNKDGRSISQL